MAAKLPASATPTIVAIITIQLKGNGNRDATDRPTCGITMPRVGPIRKEKSSATANASAMRRGGVCQVTPLNTTVTASEASRFAARIRRQYLEPNRLPPAGATARAYDRSA